MRDRQLAVVVVDGMQVLDQQVSPARGVAQHGLDFGQCCRLGLPPLWLAALARLADILDRDGNDDLVHGNLEMLSLVGAEWQRGKRFTCLPAALVLSCTARSPAKFRGHHGKAFAFDHIPIPAMHWPR